MASKAGAIRAGRAFVELFTENSKFVKGLNQAKKDLQGFANFVNGMGRQLVAAGGAVLGAFGGAVAMFASVGEGLFEMSDRTGVAVEGLGRLQFAAEQNGATLADVELGVRVMTRSLFALSNGGANATFAFGKLGLTMDQLRGMNPEEQFKLIADRISKIEDPIDRAAVAMKIFGRNATTLLPMMMGGAAGLDALGDEAERLGLVMSGEQAKVAGDFADLWGKITSQLKMAAVQIGGALVPRLTALSEWISRTLSQVIAWIQENGTLIFSVAKIAAVVVAAGVALLTLGAIASSLAAILGLVAGAVTLLGTVFGLLLSPMGLVLAALAALTTWLVQSGEASKWLATTFGPLMDTALQAFDAIKNALAAGDFKAAANVMWAGLKLAWAEGIAWLFEKWVNLKKEIVDVWRELGTSLARITTNTVAAMQTALVSASLTIAEQIGIMAIESTDLGEGAKAAARRALGMSTEAAIGGSTATIERGRVGSLQELDEQNAAAAAASQADFNSELEDSQKGLDAARAEFEAMVAAANLAGTAAGGKAFESGTTFDADAINAALEGGAGGKSSVEGSFSAFQAAAFGTGASAVEERTARATEITARQTTEIARNVRNGQGIIA